MAIDGFSGTLSSHGIGERAWQGMREVSRGMLRQPGFLDLHPPHVACRTPIRPGRARRARRGHVASGADVCGAQRPLTEDVPTERYR
jgi:hypothetical protein